MTRRSVRRRRVAGNAVLRPLKRASHFDSCAPTCDSPCRLDWKSWQNHTADVIIIGGGVAGLSTAMQLAGRGASVVVLERERLGNGSTGRAAGLARPAARQRRAHADAHRRRGDRQRARAARRRRDLRSDRLAANCRNGRARRRDRVAGRNGQVDRLRHRPHADRRSRAAPALHADRRPGRRLLLPDRRPPAAGRAGRRVHQGRQASAASSTKPTRRSPKSCSKAAAFAACERPTASITRRSSSTPAGPGRTSTPSWPTPCCRPPRSATTTSRRGPIPTHPVDRLSPAVRDRALPHLHAARKRRPDRRHLRRRARSARHAEAARRLRHVADEGGPRFDSGRPAHRSGQPPLPVDRRAHADDDHHGHHDVHARRPAVLRQDAGYRRAVPLRPASPATASCRARRSA